MKINKIYISAFGKFKDYEIDFSNGLNVIYGENENGKSTLMAFIKMMFYGSGRASSQLSKSPRVKYTPWSGEKMGGKIYFEHAGTNYCLEREFLKGDSTDKIRLTNTDLGTTQTVTSNIGSEIFSLSASAFERTVFIGSTGAFASDDDAAGEINSKLSNIALTGDEDISYQTVLDRIMDAKQKLMSKRGKTGKYDKGLLELEELNKKLLDSKEADLRKVELNQRLEEIKNESLALSKDYAEIKKIVDSENDIKNRQKLEEFLSLKAELDETNKQMLLSDSTLCDESFVKSVEFCLSKLEMTEQKTLEITEEINKTKESIALAENSDSADLKTRQAELEQNLFSDKETLKKVSEKLETLNCQVKTESDSLIDVSKKKKSFSPALLIISICLILSAVASFLITLPIATVILALVGLITGILSFIIKPLDKKAIENAKFKLSSYETEIRELKTKETELTKKIYQNTEDLNRILTVLSDGKAIIEHKKLVLDELLSKLEDQNSRLNTGTKELLNTFSKYRDAKTKDKVISLLPSLRALADSQKQLKLKLNYISHDLGGISYEKAEEKLNALKLESTETAPDFNQKKLELEQLNEKLSSLKAEFSAITTELKTAFKKNADTSVLENQIKCLEESLYKQMHFCETADIAAIALEKSFAEVRRSYGSDLEKKALSIFTLLTDGAYNHLSVSKSLDITVEKNNAFGTKELDYLSNGTIDQAYLSLRLALCELITDNEKLPLLLDDILCQYDDKRANTAIKFLKDYSKNSQAILFTCHNWITQLAETNEISVKNL